MPSVPPPNLFHILPILNFMMIFPKMLFSRIFRKCSEFGEQDLLSSTNDGTMEPHPLERP